MKSVQFAFLAEVGNAPVQRLRQREVERRSGKGRHGRSRPIGRQLQRGDVGELLFPVVEVSCAGRSLQPAPLPIRIVGILDLRLQETRRLPAAICVVKRSELLEQHVHRPVVADDVVDGQQMDVVVVAQPEQAAAQQRPLLEIERLARMLLRDCARLVLPLGLAELTQVDERHPNLEMRLHHLHRLAIDGLEDGPHQLVPPHDLVQAALQRSRVDRRGNAYARMEIVERALRCELVEHPQAALRVRCREDVDRRLRLIGPGNRDMQARRGIQGGIPPREASGSPAVPPRAPDLGAKRYPAIGAIAAVMRRRRGVAEPASDPARRRAGRASSRCWMKKWSPGKKYIEKELRVWTRQADSSSRLTRSSLLPPRLVMEQSSGSSLTWT